MLFVHDENDKANKLIPQPTATIQFPRILPLLRKKLLLSKTPGKIGGFYTSLQTWLWK